MTQQLTFRILRQKTRTVSKPHWQAYKVPLIDERMSLLDALFYIQRHQDPTLAFRCACRVGMCGSCGLMANGRETLACRTLALSLVGSSGAEIRLEPMRHMAVVRDLAVNMASFFEKYQRIMPALIPQADYKGLTLISPHSKERKVISEQRECISCGLCYSSCSVVAMSEGFLGPAALNRVIVLIADSRDGASLERLELVSNDSGLWRCHTLFNCTAVCPKGISPTQAIQRLKRKAIAHNLHKLIPIGHGNL